jgi:hypothetical protein
MNVSRVVTEGELAASVLIPGKDIILGFTNGPADGAARDGIP